MREHPEGIKLRQESILANIRWWIKRRSYGHARDTANEAMIEYYPDDKEFQASLKKLAAKAQKAIDKILQERDNGKR